MEQNNFNLDKLSDTQLAKRVASMYLDDLTDTEMFKACIEESKTRGVNVAKNKKEANKETEK